MPDWVAVTIGTAVGVGVGLGLGYLGLSWYFARERN